jgi:hypothetical protein
MALLSATVVMRRNNRALLGAIGQGFMGRRAGRNSGIIRRNEKRRISNQSKNEELESRRGGSKL